MALVIFLLGGEATEIFHGRVEHTYPNIYIYVYTSSILFILMVNFFPLPHPLLKHPCFRRSNIQGVAFDNGIGVHDALGHFNLQELAAQTL